MRKFIRKAMLGSAIISISASHVFAQDNQIKLTANCPVIAEKGAHIVTHYVLALAGPGSLRTNGGPASELLFQAPIGIGANIPLDLFANGYSNNGTSYHPFNGAVLCRYKSSNPALAPFTLSAVLVNSLNGTITSATSTQIHIKLPISPL